MRLSILVCVFGAVVVLAILAYTMYATQRTSVSRATVSARALVAAPSSIPTTNVGRSFDASRAQTSSSAATILSLDEADNNDNDTVSMPPPMRPSPGIPQSGGPGTNAGAALPSSDQISPLSSKILDLGTRVDPVMLNKLFICNPLAQAGVVMTPQQVEYCRQQGLCANNTCRYE